ncbi:MAG: response regulator transcription factor [Spirosomataceae bacterium]
MLPTKILIADDHQVVAESLGILLETIPNLEVIGIVNNGWQVLSFLEANSTDVVLADLHMPLLNGIDTTLRLKEKFPQVKVLMLTMSEESDLIKEAIRVGVDGYVVKKADKQELAQAIREVMDGKKYFSNPVLAKLAELPNPNTHNGKEHPSEIGVLSKREIEILRLIVQEKSNAEIADYLNLALTTIETHRSNILKKVGVRSALGLLKYALKHQLLTEIP